MLALVLTSLAALPQDLSTAHWIWAPWATEIERPKDEIAAFRRDFDLPSVPASASLAIATDNVGIAWLNGTRVGQVDDWQRAQRFDVTALLRPGPNTLELVARNEDPGPAGVLAILSVEFPDNTSLAISTDETWTARRRREGGQESGTWEPARVVRAYGDEPWGRIGIAEPGDSAWGGSEAPLEQRFEHPPGFRVEEAWASTSSLIALALRPDGAAAVATEEGGVVLLVDADDDGRFDEERPLTGAINSCQGLCWLSNGSSEPDELACVGDGPSGLGLYRVSTSAPDQPHLLGRFTGSGGEHGPHAVVEGPNGALYLAIGNHSGLVSPWSPASPYRTLYEGHLLPRYVDPRGHAVDIEAPGGIIVRVDRDGREWSVLAGGLRNAYDLAFNGAGHLFTFDSDMEWDLGLPWYREVRLLHVVPGGEYGWRTGSSPWPNWYPDSLPPACEVGRGSPTGMLCYAGAMFPARYRGALLAGDWSRGRVLAFHLAPRGVSYTAEAEELLLGRPLNVTDLEVDADGSLLIATGGRGTAGYVYRLSYAGEPGPAHEPQHALAWPVLPDNAPVSEAYYAIDSADRFVRFFCALALERRGLRAADLGGVLDPMTLPECLVAAARAGFAREDPADCRTGILRAAELAGSDRGEAWKVALRALDLFLQDPDAPPARELAQAGLAVLKRFPSGDRDADRELALLVARLAPEGAVDELAAALAAEPSRAEQVHLAYALRALENGWSDATRKVVADWLLSASSDGTGYSFPGYLRRLRLDFERLFGPEHAELFSAPPAASAASPAAASGGAPWSFDATLSFLAGALEAERRSLDEGARVFADACGRCHAFHGTGLGPGSLGPDLTGAGRRFSRGDLLDAVMHPSRVVPDAYRGLDVFLRDGSVESGLVVLDTADRLVVARTDGTEAQIDPADVEERRIAQLSTMPSGLLAGLTLEQVADLFFLLEADVQRAAPEASGWTRLFDGQTLAGWRCDPALWRVEDGLIAGRGAGLPDSSFLASEREYGDFLLEFDLELVAGNSGLQFRSTPHGEHGLHGYQADAGEVYWGSLYEEGGRGMLHRTPDTVWVPAVYPEGFNHYAVMARGERLLVEVNGAVTSDLRDSARARGLLGFQLHRGATEIRVRNVRVREL